MIIKHDKIYCKRYPDKMNNDETSKIKKNTVKKSCVKTRDGIIDLKADNTKGK